MNQNDNNNQELKNEEKIEIEAEKPEDEKQKRKEEFDAILEKIKKMSEAVELHSTVKDSVSKKEVDKNYLNYIDNTLEDKIFDTTKFDKIKSKTLFEIVCPNLTKIENFEIGKLEIVDIGHHFENEVNYIDKLCVYDNKFICLFGVDDKNHDNVLKYEPRKFTRADMIEAICDKLDDDKKVKMEQYDEYYVVTTDDDLKVFSERVITSLVKVEESVFDKIKNKLTSLFTINLFSKKKYLPNIELIYDTNQNRFEKIKTSKESKIKAKNRMKELLRQEREVTRNTI